MKLLSEAYVKFLERVTLSLLLEREKEGKGDDVIFEQIDLDRGPTDKVIHYSPRNVKDLIRETNRKYILGGER